MRLGRLYKAELYGSKASFRQDHPSEDAKGREESRARRPKFHFPPPPLDAISSGDEDPKTERSTDSKGGYRSPKTCGTVITQRLYADKELHHKRNGLGDAFRQWIADLREVSRGKQPPDTLLPSPAKLDAA